MIAFRRPAIAALVAAAVLLLGAAPAFAHGNDESNEAGVLVRQAIAFIVDEPGNPMLAAEKIDDAKNAADKEGVDMDLVAQAGDALDGGDIHQARSLLEQSIGARSHLDTTDPAPIGQTTPMLATGAETGIDVVTDPLAPHRDVTGGDWAALSCLVVFGALGVYLGLRFRPHHPAAAT